MNPFSSGAGTPPPALVGRSELLEKARVAIERARFALGKKSFAGGFERGGENVVASHDCRWGRGIKMLGDFQ